jgi:hypothetical protein
MGLIKGQGMRQKVRVIDACDDDFHLEVDFHEEWRLAFWRRLYRLRFAGIRIAVGGFHIRVVALRWTALTVFGAILQNSFADRVAALRK